MSRNKKQAKPVQCPICLGEYTKIHLSHKVCQKHQDWVITTCPDCRVTRFSLTKGVCPPCLEKTPLVKGFGFNKNKRGLLSKLGMGCKENG